jgi:hypothetical protein
VAQHLIDNPGAICQLNMGEGKTRIILPMLLLHFASQPVVVRLVLLPQLLAEAYAYMHACLCASSLARKLFLLPFHRDVHPDRQLLSAMRSALEHCQQHPTSCACSMDAAAEKRVLEACDTLDHHLRLKQQSLQALALSSAELSTAQRQRLENQVAEYNLVLRDTLNRTTDLAAQALGVATPAARPLEQSDGHVFADQPMEQALKTVNGLRDLLKWQRQIEDVQQRLQRQYAPWWWPYIAPLLVVAIAIAIGFAIGFLLRALFAG